MENTSDIQEIMTISQREWEEFLIGRDRKLPGMDRAYPMYGNPSMEEETLERAKRGTIRVRLDNGKFHIPQKDEGGRWKLVPDPSDF